jgi:formate/nitrite transporter
MFEIDAYTPAQIAARVRQAGVAKARLGLVPMLTLAVLAGAFIAFGAMLYTLAMTEHGLGFGPARLLGGLAFALGLLLVIVGGAELFTGNNLVVMAWADGRISGTALLRGWLLVYLGNFAGALGMAGLVAASGTLALGDGAVARTAAAIAQAKVALPFGEALVRGVLCNLLVCLACWVATGAREVAGKVLALVPPVTAFVALGFEHSVANMYLIPVAWLAGADGVDAAGLLANLAPVTLGNMIGGGVLVALVYWLVYRRGALAG